MSFFDRVYLSANKEFFADFPSLSLENIIDELGKKKQCDANGNPFIIHDNQVCRGRVKRDLLREVNRFIRELEIVDSDVDMKECVSMRQLDYLIRVFKVKKGRITSYSMIIFHVLLREFQLYDSEFNSTNILRFAIAINEIARMFYRQYPDDELVHFLVESGQTLVEEINQNRIADKCDFPGIPRRGAFDEAD